jgi:4-hydroxybenzoate polyprenyltransferase
LYSNIFIAICAVAMTFQTYWILGIDYKTSPALAGLVFFSTWVIYAIHRLVSLDKVDKSLKVDRFQIIAHYQRHIQFYTFLATIGVGVCFFFLQPITQVALVLPGLLSLGYVIPFLGEQKKRLRDINFIKIFLIAIVWSYVTVLLPLLEYQIPIDANIVGMFVERMLFIFIITLPFDLRDWEIDRRNGVQTLPAVLGVSKTLEVAFVLLLLWLGMTYFLYSSTIWGGLVLTGIITGGLIGLSPKQKQDYFFTGLVDGTMILQAVLIYFF